MAKKDIAAGKAISVQIDVASKVGDEVNRLKGFIVNQDLEKIISRYPVRATSMLTEIARKVGFQDRGQYENAVRKLLMDDVTALDFVRAKFGKLYEEIRQV